jgi:hypothetical protein
MKIYKSIFIQSIRHRLNRIFLTKKKTWILSRTACLFNDTFQNMGLSTIPRYNIQKGRIDLWIDYFNGLRLKPNFNMIYNIEREDIKTLFLQQYHFKINKKEEPSIFIMDSFSELVDRKFYSKNNKKYFFSYKSDIIKENQIFLEDEGLIETTNLFMMYNEFFDKFRKYYPNCPIIFIFFPSKLETRELFLSRASTIKNAIDQISKKFDNFYLIDIPERIIDHHPNDKNPYHFSINVYDYLANELKNNQYFIKLIS